MRKHFFVKLAGQLTGRPAIIPKTFKMKKHLPVPNLRRIVEKRKRAGR